MIAFATYSDFPIVTTILGIDLLDSSLSEGTIGIRGTANDMIRWADNIIVIGASLPVAQMGYDYKEFNKKSITVINIEKPNNLVKCDFIQMDARLYLEQWAERIIL